MNINHRGYDIKFYFKLMSKESCSTIGKKKEYSNNIEPEPIALRRIISHIIINIITN